MKTTFVVLCLLMLVLPFGFGQIRYYQTADLEKETLETFYSTQDHESFRLRNLAFEDYFQNEFLLAEEIEPKTIPLVFNVISSSASTISDEQIIKQLKILNSAFGGEITMAEDDFFQDKQVDTEISFCLFGLEAPYVNRSSKPGAIFNDFTAMTSSALGINAYGADEFINIWVCDLDLVLTQNRYSAGFAQLPMREGLLNGIVIGQNFFGPQEDNADYAQGKTLVHLMGNYLGLKPLFGFSNCEDDDVDDTPIHSSELIICAEQKEHIVTTSSCQGLPRMMTSNFMANIPDACAALFTKGQKERMHAFLGAKGPLRTLVLDAVDECEIKSSEQSENRDDENLVLQNKWEVLIYPVPASEQIHIDLLSDDLGNSSFEIKDVSGRTLRQGNVQSSMIIDVRDWESGVYYFIQYKNFERQTKSFTISH